MGNLVKYTMTNVPAGLSQMYTRVTDIANNELFSGVKAVSGNAVELDIGAAGNVGDGVIVFTDNFEGNIPSFKASVGYSLIEAGDNVSGFLDESGRISSTSVINQNSEIWSII